MMKKAKISQNKHAPSEWWTYFGFFCGCFYDCPYGHESDEPAEDNNNG